jgi:indoleamine 2,3-dioxygenase
MPAAHLHDLHHFEMSQERGFLPAQDPLDQLPPWFSAWDEMGRMLPKLLVSDRLRPAIEAMPVLDISQLETQPERERAMMLLSYFAHAYVWGGGEAGSQSAAQVATRLPASISVPWSRAAEYLGRPAVLSYASYALHNWRRIDPAGPVALGNIALQQNFLGGLDEEWFILVHVDIEAKAAPALAAFGPAFDAVLDDDADKLTRKLAIVRESLEQMCATLDRMPERCDPYIYFHRVRPYLYGWKNQPALPDGMIYEGAYEGRPQKYRGETGAQSGIIPSLDALLGITHADDPLRAYLLEMRDYMPPAHRAFLEAAETGPSVREFVERRPDLPSLQEAFRACVSLVHRFRATHLEYAATYIHKQQRTSDANPNDVGTGGTPFMPYLKKHRDETV